MSETKNLKVTDKNTGVMSRKSSERSNQKLLKETPDTSSQMLKKLTELTL